MSAITEEEIFEYIINREMDIDFVIRDFDGSNNTMSTKHEYSSFGHSKRPAMMDDENCQYDSIRIIYNKGKDNDQMLLTKIRQACAKKGYSITNANKLLGRLKREGTIEI
jgi:hypothetical protein